MHGRKPHDHPVFDTVSKPEDMWAAARRTGNYADVVRVLSLAYIQRRVAEITAQLSDTRPYDPAHPFTGGFSATARAELQAELENYQAAASWAAT